MRTIYQNIKVACLAMVSLLATSCLDLDPKDSLGDNMVWNKASNFELFANQFYGWTRDFYSGTGYQNGLSDGVHSDYRSDLTCASSINSYSQGTNTIPATDGNYTTLYTRIYYTNLLLQKAEAFGDQTSIATPKGEALFFRAYLYFELVQIYGNAILVTEPIDINSERLYAKQNDRGEVIDQCIKDLEEAAKLLPTQPAEEGRVCKYAAWALLSRVALYEGTWQKFHTGNGQNTERSSALLNRAKTAAQEVMEHSNNAYSLFYNEALQNAQDKDNQSYRYMFILEDAAQCNPANLNKSANKEYILSHRHRATDKMGINLTHAMAGNVCYVTRKMANMYLCSDGLPVDKSPLFKGYDTSTSEFQNRDARMNNTLLFDGEKFWDNDTKNGSRLTWNDNDYNNCRTANTRANSGYLTQKWAVERVVDDYYESVDYPVIRYAEVLLNFCEAIYEMNDRISDSDLDKSLNLVRRRVNPNMPKLSNSFVEANSLSMRDEIRRERTVELFLEGFRIDDLKRWKTAETEMPQDQLGVKITGTSYATSWSGQTRSLNQDGCIIMYDKRTWSEKNYLYPLPSDQLQLNPQLKQNKGWE